MPGSQSSPSSNASGFGLLQRIKSRSWSSRRRFGVQDSGVWQNFFPSDRKLLFNMQAKKLNSRGEWQPRRVAWTSTTVCFGKIENNQLIDSIPLNEIQNISLMANKKLQHDHTRTGSQESVESLSRPTSNGSSLRHDGRRFVDNIDFEHALEIKTKPGGHNSGRTYYIKMSNHDEAGRALDSLSSAAKKALQTYESRNKLERSQAAFREVFHSTGFQIGVAVLITANFIVNIAQTQILPAEESPNQRVFDNLEIFFTAVFALELAINAYGHWFLPFLKDGWNALDVTVVTVSLVALLVEDAPGLNSLRLVRAFRIMRLFGRVGALKKIISGLILSIVPVINSIIILAIATMLYAIIGVNLFREDSYTEFGSFARALYTLFTLLTGKAWVDEIAAFEEDGSVNYKIVLYLVSYVLVVNWTLLQVGVAVLLDNFISATHQMEQELAWERRHEEERRAIHHVLDPLLDHLIRSYDTDTDLSNRIMKIFEILDADDSGGLTITELKCGLKILPFTHPINASEEDIDNILQDAECRLEIAADSQTPALSPAEFEKAIRKQLQMYAQRMITDSIHDDPDNDQQVVALSCFKTSLLMLENVTRQNKQAVDAVTDRLDGISSSLLSLHSLLAPHIASASSSSNTLVKRTGSALRVPSAQKVSFSSLNQDLPGPVPVDSDPGSALVGPGQAEGNLKHATGTPGRTITVTTMGGKEITLSEIAELATHPGPRIQLETQTELELASASEKQLDLRNAGPDGPAAGVPVDEHAATQSQSQAVPNASGRPAFQVGDGGGRANAEFVTSNLNLNGSGPAAALASSRGGEVTTAGPLSQETIERVLMEHHTQRYSRAHAAWQGHSAGGRALTPANQHAMPPTHYAPATERSGTSS